MCISVLFMIFWRKFFFWRFFFQIFFKFLLKVPIFRCHIVCTLKKKYLLSCRAILQCSKWALKTEIFALWIRSHRITRVWLVLRQNVLNITPVNFSCSIEIEYYRCAERSKKRRFRTFDFLYGQLSGPLSRKLLIIFFFCM